MKRSTRRRRLVLVLVSVLLLMLGGGAVVYYYYLVQERGQVASPEKTQGEQAKEADGEQGTTGEEPPEEEGSEEPDETGEDSTPTPDKGAPQRGEEKTGESHGEPGREPKPEPPGEDDETLEPEDTNETPSPGKDVEGETPDQTGGTKSTTSANGEETPKEDLHVRKEDTVYTEELRLQGVGATSTPMKKLWKEWLERMIQRGEVRILAPLLEEQIRECAPALARSSQLNYANYRNAPLLMEAVDLCYMARMVDLKRLDELIRPLNGRGEQSEKSWSQFMRWLLLDKARPLHRLLQEFVLNSGRAEEFPRTLSVFYSLWKDTPERDRVRYMNLAIACSLVCKDIAHSRGRYRDPDEPRVEIPELFQYYRTEDLAGRLLTDMRKLSVTDLLHVVDVRLPRSEFDWVQKKLREYQRGNWGGTYSHIEYMMERATYGEDPYIKYSFEEIEEEGGICADQAYFCATTAKCRGIPAAIIVGDGARGLHAWVGLMTSDKGWTTTGSYGYMTGRTQNPCSGQSVHPSVLYGRDRKLPEDKVEQVSNCMVLSDYLVLLGCKQEALATARFVRSFVPQFTTAWQNLIDVMTLCGEGVINDNDWRRLHSELYHASKKNSELLDLTEKVLNEHILAGKRDIVKINALKQSARRMSELMQVGRTDLAIDSMRRSADVYVNAADSRSLMSYFRSTLKEYIDNRYFFEQVYILYVQSLEACTKKLKEKGELDEKHYDLAVKNMWKSCAKDADSLFMKSVFETSDFFAIKKEVQVVRLIAESWRKSGNEKRATDLEELAGEQLEKSRSDSTPDKAKRKRKR